MPIKRSSIKDVRRIKKRRVRNIAAMSRLRTAIAKVLKALDPVEADKTLILATKLLDKAAKTNLIHHRNADRKKSRLAKAVQKLKTPKKAAE